MNPYFKIEVFDVGQGSCTLLTPRDHQYPHDPIIMHDCGSKKTVATLNHWKKHSEITAPVIALAVIRSLPLPERRARIVMHIIISHYDEDHISLTEYVLKQIVGKTTGKILISSPPIPQQRTRALQQLLGFIGNNRFVEHYIHTGALALEQRINQTYTNRQLQIRILAALLPPQSDPNHFSIVALVSFLNYAVILTGDATGKVTDQITAQQLQPFQNYTRILFGSHHGADTKRSNNQTWLGLVNPHYVIFSAYTPRYELHPRFSIVNRVGQLPSIIRTHQHQLACGKTNHCNNPSADLTNYSHEGEWGTYSTRRAMFSTFNEGHFTFMRKQNAFYYFSDFTA